MNRCILFTTEGFDKMDEFSPFYIWMFCVSAIIMVVTGPMTAFVGRRLYILVVLFYTAVIGVCVSALSFMWT